MSLRASLRLAAGTALATLLGGCLGGLVGGGKPDALYRFGDAGPAATAPLATPRRVLAVLPVQLPAAAAGDRILTVEGNAAAYVKDVRWVSPAATLFSDAIRGALVVRVPDLALVDRITARQAQQYLSVRIDRFETRFAEGATAPVVVVEGEASLADPATRAITARRPIVQRVDASGSDASSVAAAYDGAVRAAGVDVADWVNQRLTVKAAGGH